MFIQAKDFPYRAERETPENREIYEQLCIAHYYFSQKKRRCLEEVRFVATLSSDLRGIKTKDIKTRFNFMQGVLMNLKFLTLDDFLSIFPFSIYLDRCYSNCSIAELIYDAACNAFERYSIEIDNIADPNASVGSVDDWLAINKHPLLDSFRKRLDETAEILLKRDVKLRAKYHHRFNLLNDETFIF